MGCQGKQVPWGAMTRVSLRRIVRRIPQKVDCAQELRSCVQRPIFPEREGFPIPKKEAFSDIRSGRESLPKKKCSTFSNPCTVV